MRLQLIVADLHADSDELGAVAPESLPRMPAFERAFQLGRRRVVREDWRAFLARQAGRPDLVGVPTAQVAAAAFGSGSERGCWYATPVHLTAGMDHLRLHPAGLLQLSDEEATLLSLDFASAFGGSGLQLRPLFGGFILIGLDAPQALTQDPAAFLGSDIRQSLAAGTAARPLLLLNAEIEMWLHDHAVNRQRARRGQLAISGLWLWGGGPHSELRRERVLSLPEVHANEAYVAGLWHLCGGEAHPRPASCEEWLQSRAEVARRGLAIVVVSAAPQSPRDLPLRRLEDSWFTPALAALRAGRVSRVGIVASGQHVELGRAAGWRVWRRAKPWWEHLGR